MSKFRKNQFRKADDNVQVELVKQILAPPPKLEGKISYKGRRNVKVTNNSAPTFDVNVILQQTKQESQEYQQHEEQKIQQSEVTAKTPKRLPEVQRGFESMLLKSLTPRRQSAGKVKTPAVETQQEKSGAYILQQYKNQLTSFEQQEILQYNKIYFWGQKVKKQYGDGNPNSGYDDAKGDYLGKPHDHIAYRYELIILLGEGSFGKVYKAFDHCNQSIVAIKIVKNKKRFHRQGLVEVRLLETIRKNDPEDISNCLKLTHSFYFRSHLCIVCEMYSVNLYELLVRYDLKGLKFNIVKNMTIQAMNAMCYLHNLNIIHADIKPENILLVNDNSSKIKIIDIGSGCFKGQTIYTYIQSRFYRAPEVILGLNYSIEIDVWSMGCVFAELVVGLPIFPGDNESEQFGLITEYLGMPPISMLQKSPRMNEFLSGGRLKTKHRPGSKSLKQFFAQRSVPADFVDLVEKMLVWNPYERQSPHQLMQHPFIQKISQEIKNVGDLGQGAVGFDEKRQMKQLQKENEVKSVFSQNSNSLGFCNVKKTQSRSSSRAKEVEANDAEVQKQSNLPALFKQQQ